jgi:serine/threonine protein kinase
VAHPSIVRYREHFDTIDALYIITELLRGPDLLSDILHRRSYSEEAARAVLTQLLSGLSHLHRKGIVHRDVKLENIVLVDEEEGSLAVRIIDFGLAEQSTDAKKLFNDCCGTPLYAAPELLRPEAVHGEGVDIWAAGVVLYALLSGNFPFFGQSLENLQCAILRGDVDFTCPVWKTRTAGAKSLVRWMLTLDPGTRPSAEVLLRHPWLLRVCEGGQHTLTTVEDALTILPASHRTRSRVCTNETA